MSAHGEVPNPHWPPPGLCPNLTPVHNGIIINTYRHLNLPLPDSISLGFPPGCCPSVSFLWLLFCLPPAGSLVGQTVLITGATSGLGKEAAAVLAGAGARVVFCVRNVKKAQATAGWIRERCAHLLFVL